MRPLRVLALSGIVTLTALAVLVFLAPAPTLEAGSCICPGDHERFWSIPGWGMASTCTQAKNNCEANAQSAAHDFCEPHGVCAFGDLTFRPASGVCFPKEGQLAIDCDLEYSCYRCIEFPDL